VHGDKFFITVGVAGLFTEHVPVIFPEEHAFALSVAGADCLHVHKAGTEDLEEVVRIAHQYGLLVEAYITHTMSQDNIVRVSSNSTSVEYLGIPTETPSDAVRIAKWMQDIGVDLIGVVTGMVYQVGAGGIADLVLDRVDAVVNAVDVPVVLEGGLNLDNWKVAKEHNVDVIMISTSIEYMLYEHLGEIIHSLDI